jgi:hypothetical protein
MLRMYREQRRRECASATSSRQHPKELKEENGIGEVQKETYHMVSHRIEAEEIDVKKV